MDFLRIFPKKFLLLLLFKSNLLFSKLSLEKLPSFVILYKKVKLLFFGEKFSKNKFSLNSECQLVDFDLLIYFQIR
jgi:hypothetical protein